MNILQSISSIFTSKDTSNSTIKMQKSYIKELENQLTTTVQQDDYNALETKFNQLGNNFTNLSKKFNNLDLNNILELKSQVQEIDMDKVIELTSDLTILENLNESVDDLNNKFENIDQYSLADMVEKFEEYGGSFSNEEMPNYDSDIEDIHYKINLTQINQRLSTTTPRNIILHQKEDFNETSLSFLTLMLEMIELENIKYANEYELELNLNENKIFNVSFIDSHSKSYLGLEFNIDINERTTTPYIDLENETLTEDQYKTLLEFILPNKFDKVFEFYNEHRKG